MIIMMIQLCVAKTCSFNMMFCLFISDSSLKIATEDVRKSFNMMLSHYLSCLKLYYFVVYLYVNGSGSITSVGEERANLSAVIYL